MNGVHVASPTERDSGPGSKSNLRLRLGSSDAASTGLANASWPLVDDSGMRVNSPTEGLRAQGSWRCRRPSGGDSRQGTFSQRLVSGVITANRCVRAVVIEYEGSDL